MKSFVLCFIVCSCCVIEQYHAKFSNPLVRSKRDAAGALDIVTNHAQPIHADVKTEHTAVDKVVPPKDTINQGKSLRKSNPHIKRLDLVRGVSRVVTVLVLLVTAVLEFYPLVQQLCYTIRELMYHYNK